MAVTADAGVSSPAAGPSDVAAPGDGRLLLFTWNLHSSPEALELACKYLAKQASCIAAFQELPEEFGTDQLVLWGEGRLRRLDQPALTSTSRTSKWIESSVALIASEDIEIDLLGKKHEYSPLDSERRLAGVTVTTKSWPRVQLQVLAVHAWDQWNRNSEVNRGDWKRIARGVLDEFWVDGPLVVMGDLNANPWDHEISSRSGFYALRQKDWPRQDRKTKQHGAERYARPLYNPMWVLLPDGSERPGTHYYDGADSDLRWHCFDQILVSGDLQPYIRRPEALETLDGESLVKQNGEPRIGNHLPVQLTIDMGKVNP